MVIAKNIAKDMEKNIKEYANQIQTIDDFVEVVRKMPGMYIGRKGNPGFLNMIREIFQNSVDELEKKDSPCTWINILYDERTHITTVEDNGRGIPFEAIIRIFTSQHTSSNYTKKEGEFSSGLHGVGSKVTNALSEWFTVESYILGEARRVEFKNGKPSKEGIIEIPNPGKQGTIVSFKPSYEAMGNITLSVDDVFGLICLILPLTKIGSKITFKGIYSDGREMVEEMVNIDGIITNLIMKTTNPLIKPIILSKYTGMMTADLAFTYDSNDLMVESITAFSNFCPTLEGTHINGFLDGVCQFFRNYMNKVYLANNKKNKLVITNADIKTGLKSMIAVKHLNPVFTGQAKEILSNEDMEPFVKKVVMDGLTEWSKSNPKDLQKLCKYYKDVAEIRVKSEEGKVKLSSKYESSSFTGMPRKYRPPQGKKDLEFIITEGNSALGSAANSRCKQRQGLYPIRGKMPNAFTTNRSKFLDNEEVAAIITIVGGGYGRNFDLNKVPWDKVVFMCFTGDTEVKMLDGTIKTFEELVEMEKENPGRDYWVYSYDTINKKMVPGRAYAPRITNYVNQIVHVTLDNGHVIKCTPEHLILTKNRGYVPAISLMQGESLQSLYTKNQEGVYNKDRELFYDENTFNIHHGKKIYEENLAELVKSEEYSEIVKQLQEQGKYLRMGATLLRDGFVLTEENLNANYVQLKELGYRLYSTDTILKEFETFDQFILASLMYLNTKLSDEEYERYRNRDINNTLSDRSQKTKRTMIVKDIKEMEKQGIEFTEENHNHSVISVQLIDLEQPIPVYDMTVDKYHNFLLSTSIDGKSGVYGHNCDADFDGFHIRQLLLKFFLLYMPEMIESGRVYSAVPPLYTIENKEKYTYLTDRMAYIDYVQKSFMKSNNIQTERGKTISKGEMGKILFDNIDYTYDLESLANKYALDYSLLETVLLNSHLDKKRFKTVIETKYRFINVEEVNGVTVIKGLHNSQYETLILNQSFLNECNIIYEYFKNNESLYFMMNGQKVTLYELMKTFENHAPSNLQRNKGLGEMNSKQLAESTLHPDSNRTLIQYTLESAKQEIEMIRYLESNKQDLVKDIKASRLDLMG